MSPGTTRIASHPGSPRVWMLEARGADQRELRASARTLTDDAAAPYASRSYRYPYALVAWHHAPVGIDIERVEKMDQRFAQSICTPAERAGWASIADPDVHFSSVWSSKEALAKALGNPIGYDPQRLGAPVFWPGGQAGRWQATTLTVPRGHVAWLCWRLT